MARHMHQNPAMRLRARVITSLAVLGPVVLTGCTQDDPQKPEASEVAPHDPMVAVNDPDSDEYVEGARALVHDLGRGSATFPVKIPATVDAVRVYVSCAPDAKFTVVYGGRFAGGCTSPFGNSGEFDRVVAGSATELTVDLPEDVDRWVVVLPVESGETE